MNRAPVRLLAYGVAVAVFVLDRITKGIVKQHVSPWDIHAVIPGFFNIVHTENPGAAFSLFSSAPPGWRSFFLVALSTAAIAVMSVLLWRLEGRTGESAAMRFGMAAILGGALGNVYDRILYGTVTDFLELYYRDFRWPAFNVADSAITMGACLLLLDMLLTRCALQKV